MSEGRPDAKEKFNIVHCAWLPNLLLVCQEPSSRALILEELGEHARGACDLVASVWSSEWPRVRKKTHRGVLLSNIASERSGGGKNPSRFGNYKGHESGQVAHQHVTAPVAIQFSGQGQARIRCQGVPCWGKYIDRRSACKATNPLGGVRAVRALRGISPAILLRLDTLGLKYRLHHDHEGHASGLRLWELPPKPEQKKAAATIAICTTCLREQLLNIVKWYLRQRKNSFRRLHEVNHPLDDSTSLRRTITYRWTAGTKHLWSLTPQYQEVQWYNSVNLFC